MTAPDVRTEPNENSTRHINPRVGDRFHEMFGWWVFVVERSGPVVGVIEFAGPGCPPIDGALWIGHVDDFAQRYRFDHYLDHGMFDVTGWAEMCMKRAKP